MQIQSFGRPHGTQLLTYNFVADMSEQEAKGMSGQ